MPWRLRIKKGGLLSIPKPPKLPKPPRLPRPPKLPKLGRPPKPPAPPGYEYYWSDK
jgi:hypothetical protein